MLTKQSKSVPNLSETEQFAAELFFYQIFAVLKSRSCEVDL